jgi:hypothetical protein
MHITLTCQYCGKCFERSDKIIKMNERRGHKSIFCSNDCSAKSRVSRSTYVCASPQCFNEIFRTPREYAQGRVFCSKSCANKQRVGNRHPLYKNGIGGYRERALQFYGSECTLCGYNIEQVLQVHHRDGDRSNNAIDNLDVLCPTHHQEYEVGLRNYNLVV